MTMTMTREAQIHAAQRERDALRRERARRVEILGLPSCRICAGAEHAATDDPELRCDCTERHNALQARLAEILEQRRDPSERRLADVISP